MTVKLGRTRRQISEVVTEEAICREADRVLSNLAGAWRIYSSSDVEDEERRREVIAKTANWMVTAALVCVREYQPRHYSALKTAAPKYLESMIENGTAEFRINKPRGAKEFWEWAESAEIASAHDEIVRRLKAVWSMKPRLATLPDREATKQLFAFKARGNVPLYAGNRLLHARKSDRVAGIREASREVMAAEISDSTARRWLKQFETPARVSHMIIANALKRTPRKVQDLIRRGRAQIRFAQELDRRSR